MGSPISLAIPSPKAIPNNIDAIVSKASTSLRRVTIFPCEGSADAGGELSSCEPGWFRGIIGAGGLSSS